MEVLALSLLKSLASTCLKFYLGYLFSSGGIEADKSELGYKIPSWYMNPGSQVTVFYAYGTSVKGDEFESLEDARQQAVTQMATLIRRSQQRIISEEIRYDQSNIKQRRLVELFLRGEGLDDFILTHATVDKKQILKVKNSEPDLRAFVRLTLSSEDYIARQEETLRELRKKLTYQKSEDIMEEMDAEMKNLNASDPSVDAPVPAILDGIPLTVEDKKEAPVMPATPPASIPREPAEDNTQTTTPTSPAGDVFNSMENELDNLK